MGQGVSRVSSRLCNIELKMCCRVVTTEFQRYPRKLSVPSLPSHIRKWNSPNVVFDTYLTESVEHRYKESDIRHSLLIQVSHPLNQLWRWRHCKHIQIINCLTSGGQKGQGKDMCYVTHVNGPSMRHNKQTSMISCK